MISVLVPAAGRGVRMGDDGPKALMMLAGRAMLLWSLDALSAVPGVGEILVAAPGDAMGDFERVRASWTSGSEGAPWKATLEGGATRRESVAILVERATGSRVLVHDAARPCATTRWIASLLSELGSDPAGVPALPVSDSLKRGRGGVVTDSVSRDGLHAVQTPQIFDRALLASAHADWSARPGATDVTDDAALVERIGTPVRLLAGDPLNLKVTFPDEVSLAEKILELRRNEESSDEP